MYNSEIPWSNVQNLLGEKSWHSLFCRLCLSVSPSGGDELDGLFKVFMSPANATMIYQVSSTEIHHQ